MKATLYLLLIRCPSGYKVHSFHATREALEQWVKCKEHDGEDTAVAELSEDDMESLTELFLALPK
jgi:hypothetical protein